MHKRFVSIWFPHLKTDWFIRHQPGLKKLPFVLVAPDHGRMVITAANAPAQGHGVYTGMVLADAKAIINQLQYFDDETKRAATLLNSLGEWCIRYTPVVSTDAPDGLLLDASGCAHLWGGEEKYLAELKTRLNNFGYHTGIAIADTIGTAWAMARFGGKINIIENFQQSAALLA